MTLSQTSGTDRGSFLFVLCKCTCERERERKAGVSEEGLPFPKGADQQSLAVYTIGEKFLMKLPENCWLRKCAEFTVLLVAIGVKG